MMDRASTDCLGCRTVLEGRLDAVQARVDSGVAEQPSVDPSRFDPAGAWAEPVASWAGAVDPLATGPWPKTLIRALEELPRPQRVIVVLRDVKGLASDEVCEVLGIFPGDMRALLHHGRSRLRAALETERASRGE
jgi:RNA polymerase sigma-70 factor (ECF subfamily)